MSIMAMMLGATTAAPPPLPTYPYAVALWGTDGSGFYSTSSGTSWSSLTPTSGPNNEGFNSSGSSFNMPSYNNANITVWNNTLSSYVSSAAVASFMRAHRNSTGTICARNFGNSLYRSTNGGSSFSVALATTGTYFNSGLHYGNGKWFHTNVDTSVTPRNQYHYTSSDDGVTWAQNTTGLPATSGSGGFAGFSGYMNGKHHWWGQNSTTGTGLYTSTDGLTWSFVGTSNLSPGGVYGDNNGGAVIYNGGTYYTGVSSNIFYSSNGYTWSSVALSTLSITGANIQGLGFTNGVFILATSDGTTARIYTSTTPTVSGSWTLRNSSASTASSAMALGLNQMNQYV
jgi:hypothetical protein